MDKSDKHVHAETGNGGSLSSDLKDDIKELIGEIRGQKHDLNALREEVRGISLSVSSEVKKFRTEKDIRWKYEGNRIQFDFNSELEENLKQGLWAIDNGKMEYAMDLFKESCDKLQSYADDIEQLPDIPADKVSLLPETLKESRAENTCLAYKGGFKRCRAWALSNGLEKAFKPHVKDITQYCLHSLRSGGATAANSGIPDRMFKRHGRWLSDSAKDGCIKDFVDEKLKVSLSLGL
ncbi:uncharacterized protein LOC123553335 [Mercenaria mercenaria]|uniref:uncharacterized protein LOC123553335 n=1 Tax=Mercenaria mercenaria TaxID=6596 RepID=UPI00234F6BC7|nr:uncharacterized protein LOC123553335 [Mercenaria mercenaria]